MSRTPTANASHGIQHGFTLIELMVVVAIVAIIAGIAYPNYITHVAKSKRATAESFMQNIANRQEQYILDARTYTLTIGTGGLNMIIPPEVGNNYTVVISNATNVAYTITATAIGGQAINDPVCPVLTLDQSGLKTPTTKCW